MADYNSTFTGAQVDAAVVGRRLTSLLDQSLAVTPITTTRTEILNINDYDEIHVFGEELNSGGEIVMELYADVAATWRTSGYSRLSMTESASVLQTATFATFANAVGTLQAGIGTIKNAGNTLLPTSMHMQWGHNSNQSFDQIVWYTGNTEVHSRLGFKTLTSTAANGRLYVVGVNY